MTGESMNSSASARAEAEKIVASGTEIRRRLGEVVAQAAERSQQAGQGLVALAQAVLDGARDGLEKSVPANHDDVLRQVVDALGDGLSQAALAARLAVEEASSASRQFASEDLCRLRDDVQAVNGLFVESVSRTLKRCGSLTATECSSLYAHAGRVNERLGQVVGSVLDAVRRDPLLLAQEGFHAGVGTSRHAAGALFTALGQLLQRAGEQLRQSGTKS